MGVCDVAGVPAHDARPGQALRPPSQDYPDVAVGQSIFLPWCIYVNAQINYHLYSDTCRAVLHPASVSCYMREAGALYHTYVWVAPHARGRCTVPYLCAGCATRPRQVHCTIPICGLRHTPEAGSLYLGYLLVAPHA